MKPNKILLLSIVVMFVTPVGGLVHLMFQTDDWFMSGILGLAMMFISLVVSGNLMIQWIGRLIAMDEEQMTKEVSAKLVERLNEKDFHFDKERTQVIALTMFLAVAWLNCLAALMFVKWAVGVDDYMTKILFCGLAALITSCWLNHAWMKKWFLSMILK